MYFRVLFSKRAVRSVLSRAVNWRGAIAVIVLVLALAVGSWPRACGDKPCTFLDGIREILHNLQNPETVWLPLIAVLLFWLYSPRALDRSPRPLSKSEMDRFKTFLKENLNYILRKD